MKRLFGLLLILALLGGCGESAPEVTEGPLPANFQIVPLDDVADFGGFTAVRKFRGIEYHITVENPDHVEKGVRQLIVDGKNVDGIIVPFEEGKTSCDVRVIMG